MGGRVFDLLSSPHRSAEALMPWLLNGTLKPAERRRLEAHLRDCPECRAELERQRRLAALYCTGATAAPAADADAAFARLAARLDAEGAPRAPRSPAGAWRVVAMLQFCVIAALAWTVWALRPGATGFNEQLAAYRGLGVASAPAGGDAIVFFAAEAADVDIRRTLRRAGARIVDGPTAAGAYVLRFERDTTTALTALRSDRTVLRVEGLAAASGSPPVAPWPRD